MDINKSLDLVLEHFQSGNLSQAEHICMEILKRQPNNVDALHFLGVICHRVGHYDSAIEHITKALQINPVFADAYNNLGNIFQETKRFDEAIACYRKAIEINPRSAKTYYNLGICLQDKEELDEAIACYQKALQLNFKTFGLYNNLGLALQEKGKVQLNEAINCYQNALKLNPTFAEAHNNLGTAFHNSKGQLNEAINCYQNALKLNPTFAEAYYNLGNSFKEKRQLGEANVFYRKALQLNPDYAEAHFNLSLSLLLTGNFKEGWREYEWRWRIKDHYQHNLSQPQWDGVDITGLTILVHAEQGFGDAIQFIRYIPLVAQQGAIVIFECPEELKSLVQYFQGISKIIIRGEQLPKFDIHSPLLSLPFVFGTTPETIPAKIPYITVASSLKEKWREKVPHNKSKLKIGLAWSGNPKHKRDSYRSCLINSFSPLAQFDNIIFYSLQKGEAAKELINPPQKMSFVDYTEDIYDFADTAALIENLDLVISVDTAVSHLAGALGKPVWTLLPFAPDWRWMLDREDSPWYPSMRLFRQSSLGDWQSVITRVIKELNIFLHQAFILN